MTLSEYLRTSDSQRVSKFSIVALQGTEYTIPRLTQFPLSSLKSLAMLWGVAQNGQKLELVRRIIRRKQFREQLCGYEVESLCRFSRRQLVEMAKEAGLFYSALNKRNIAGHLLSWRQAEAERAARQLGEAKHFRLVRNALIRGMNVPLENRERYGFDSDGRMERQILGIPRSAAVRKAPAAIAAARQLSQSEFIHWVETHEEECRRVNFIAPTAMCDRGKTFWAAVQRAFEAESQGTLFR